MNKSVALLLSIALLMMLILGACSTDTGEDGINEYDTSAEGEYANGDEEETSPSYVDVDWTEAQMEYTDPDGYVFQVKYKLSPWMQYSSNEETIQSIWSEVGDDQEIPVDFSDWGLQDWGDGRMYKNDVKKGAITTDFSQKMNDAYYLIGTVEIDNATDGWNITESNPKNVEPYASWYIRMPDSLASDPQGGFLSHALSICRVFYSSSYSDESNGIYVRANMKSDHWGAVPFIMMIGENITPNNPNGEIRDALSESFFKIGGDELTLEVVE